MAVLARAEALSDVGHAEGELVDHLRRHFLRDMRGSVCGRVRRRSLSTCYAVAILVCLIEIVWYPCYVSWNRLICPPAQSCTTAHCFNLRLKLDAGVVTRNLPTFCLRNIILIPSRKCQDL